MGFLSPWYLTGLLLLGIPVFVHLLRKHIARPRPVGSLMFFERGVQSSARHRRLRHLTLFALRLALLLFLVIAFADPFVRRKAIGSTDSLLVIAVDRSFSMQAAGHFRRGVEQATTLLAAKPASQRAQVISLGGQPQLLMQPTTDSSQLRAALESLEPGDGHGSFTQLAQVMRGIVEASPGAIDLHLFSDVQRSAVPANFADMALPPTITLHLHPLSGDQAAPNWAVESVDAPEQLADPKDPQHSRVRAVIAGYNAPAKAVTASLAINGVIKQSRAVEVPADGRATVEFSPLDVSHGLNRCEIRLQSGDVLPGDDVSYFAIRRSDPERVLFVHAAADVRSATYFGAALRVALQASFVLQVTSEAQTADLDPSRFAFVVLADSVALPPIFQHTLEQYVAKGGNVLISLGTAARPGTELPLWHGTVQQTHDYARDGGGIAVGQLDFSSPVLQNVRPGTDSGGWSAVTFRHADKVDSEGAAVLAKLADGTPLLMEKHGGAGRILLFTSGFDNLTNDLPLHPVFVSFVDRLSHELSGTIRTAGSMLVDSYLQLHPTSEARRSQNGSVEVLDPAGRHPLSLEQSQSAVNVRLEHAGFYHIRFADGSESLIGVNPDRLESDLKPLSPELQQLWSARPQGRAEDGSGIVPSQSSTRKASLWWYVMLLALVVAVAETILATRYMNSLREEA